MRKNGKNGLPQGENFYWKRGVIYTEIWHQGKMLGQFSTGTAVIKEALAFKADKLSDLIKQEETRMVEVKKGVRVSELFDDYIARIASREADSGAYANSRPYETNSYKAQTRIDKNLRPSFGSLKPHEVSTALLAQYKAKRRREGAKVATVNTEFRTLRATLRRGTKTTPRKVNPLHIPDFSAFINMKAEEAAARTGTISLAQFNLIFEHASEHLKPVLQAVYFSGIRQKEIKWVRRAQVAFDQHVINLCAGETKDGGSRTCAMNDQVERVLRAWEERTAQEFPKCQWFFHLDGQQLGNFKTAWNATLKRAGLRVSDKNLVMFHDTRRSAITTLDELGVEEKDIMANSGHQTTKMSRRYNQSKAASERVRIAQNKMPGVGITQADSISPGSSSDWMSELTQLKALLDGGILSQEEFGVEKARVMANR